MLAKDTGLLAKPGNITTCTLDVFHCSYLCYAGKVEGCLSMARDTHPMVTKLGLKAVIVQSEDTTLIVSPLTISTSHCIL